MPRWGDAASVEAMLEDQEDIEAEEAARAETEKAEAEKAAAAGTPTVAEQGPGAGGRPGFGFFQPTEKDRALVKDMSRCSMPQAAMTLMVRWPDGRPISQKTLRAHFADELITGHIEVGMSLYGALYKKAMAGDVGALCFLLKVGYGFRETIHQEVTGKDGTPLGISSGVIVVPGMASSEEWESTVRLDQQKLAARAADFVAGTGEFAKPEGPVQ